MIGMIIIHNQIHRKENRIHYEYYTRGGQFLQDLQSHQWLEFGERWFGLPGFRELAEFVRYVYTVEMTPSQPMRNYTYRTSNNKYTIPIHTTGKYYMPIVQRKNHKGYYRPFSMEPEMPDSVKIKMKEWLEYVVANPNQSF